MKDVDWATVPLLQRGCVSVNVTEHRAPTDKSVQLLREMEDAARARITASVRLENSVIDAVIQSIPDHLNHQTEFLILLQINGKRSEVRLRVKYDSDPDKIPEILHRAVADHIASLLLVDAFRAVTR